MAKHTDTQGENVVSFKVSSLTGDLRKRVAAVQKPILSAAGDWNNWQRKCGDIAAPVMKLYRAIAAHFDTIPGAKPFRFIDFCRMLDPQTPKDSTEYREYKTYKSLQYMRILDQNANRDSTKGSTQQPGGARSKALDFAARLMKFVQSLPNLPLEAAELLTQATAEAGLSKNMRTRFSERVAAIEPLWRATVTKTGVIKALDIIPAPAKASAPANVPPQAGLEQALREATANASKASKRKAS